MTSRHSSPSSTSWQKAALSNEALDLDLPACLNLCLYLFLCLFLCLSFNLNLNLGLCSPNLDLRHNLGILTDKNGPTSECVG